MRGGARGHVTALVSEALDGQADVIAAAVRAATGAEVEGVTINVVFDHAGARWAAATRETPELDARATEMLARSLRTSADEVEGSL